MDNPEMSPEWQCVMVLWGSKYPVSLVNHQVARIRALSHRTARFLLITDRHRDGLDPVVVQREFDPFFLNPKFLGPGCQAKLTVFATGVVPTDLPAVFVDLDTVILGDISRAITLLDTKDRVRILPSAVLPFGPIGRFFHRNFKGRRYARGNSSIILWQPGRCDYIAEGFRSRYEANGDLSFRPMIADERFISWSAQSHMARIPDDFAVKFPNDFMHPSRRWLLLKASLPWVRRRRAKLAAVTLPGEDIKPERLLSLSDGAEIRDRKNRVLIWSEAALGPVKAQIEDYYKDRPDI